MKESTLSKWLFTIFGWIVAFVVFFPIFWMTLTAFKTEKQAYSSEIFFTPTLASFAEVFQRSNYMSFALNSIYLALGSTLLCYLIALPAAYRMAFFPTAKTQDTLLWMLSTKMMPAVGVLMPIFLLCKYTKVFGHDMLDNIWALIIINALMNLPIAVWMAYTYLLEVPPAILEAARIDGGGLWDEIWHVLRPIALPGLASTALLLIILSWNEAFWSINLASSKAAPLTVFIASYSSPEGAFWAKLSGASVLAVAPILVMGWLCQKQLVSGLTFGAVK